MHRLDSLAWYVRRDSQFGDHLHDIGLSDGEGEERHPERIVQFDYDEVDRALGNEDPAETVDFAEAASAVKSILLWICSPPSLLLCGARAASLLAWIDPVEAATHDRDSLVKIADQAGITKQAISKWLVELRDSLGITVGVGKRHTTRQAYREAQVKAFAEGRHASFRRKDTPKR